MSRGKLVTSNGKPYAVSIMCPGCGETHLLRVQQPDRPCWSFNGDYERPTFSPSLLVTTGHYMDGHKQGRSCYCTNPDPDFKCIRCHSFIRDGRIQFLNDSTHHLAGQTVDLPEIEEAA